MKRTHPSRRRRLRHLRASMEPLEPRQLLSASVVSGVSFAQSDLLSNSYTAVDSAGNIYFAGAFRGTIDADPSSSVVPLTNTVA